MRPRVTRGTESSGHISRPLVGYTMANFSVEWLSRSYYEETTVQALHSKVHSDNEEFTKKSRRKNPPSSPNNSCGHTSGSESEVRDDSEGEAKQRRPRTMFTAVQISKLENTFSKHKYLGPIQTRKIADKLKLSETQVKTWFQNRRMKLKREVRNVRRDFVSVPAALLPPAPQLFQHPVVLGQLPAFCHSTGLCPRGHQHPLHPAIVPPRFF